MYFKRKRNWVWKKKQPFLSKAGVGMLTYWCCSHHTVSVCCRESEILIPVLLSQMAFPVSLHAHLNLSSLSSWIYIGIIGHVTESALKLTCWSLITLRVQFDAQSSNLYFLLCVKNKVHTSPVLNSVNVGSIYYAFSQSKLPFTPNHFLISSWFSTLYFLGKLDLRYI